MKKFYDLKNLQIILIFVICLINNSCQDIIETDDNIRKYRLNNLLSDDVIMPLTETNYWTYKLRFSDSTITSSNDISTRILTGDTIIENERWFKNFPYYFINKSDGLHVKTVDGWYLGYKDMLYAKYPAIAGDTFSFNNLFCTVISVDTIIQVPAGQFRCYFYQKTLTAFPDDTNVIYTNNQFFCPGIGLIQDEYYTFDNFDKMRSIYELIEYKLK